MLLLLLVHVHLLLLRLLLLCELLLRVHLLCVHLLPVLLPCLLRVLLLCWMLLLLLLVLLHIHLLVLHGRRLIHSLVLVTGHRIESLLPLDGRWLLPLKRQLVYILRPIRDLASRCHFLLDHRSSFLALRLRYHWAVHNK